MAYARKAVLYHCHTKTLGCWASILVVGCQIGDSARDNNAAQALVDPAPIFASQKAIASCTSADAPSCGGSLYNQCSLAGSSYSAIDYGCLSAEVAALIDLDGSEWIQPLVVNGGEVVISAGEATNYPFVAVVRGSGAPDVADCVAANWYSLRLSEGVDYTAGETLYLIVDHPDDGADMGFNMLTSCAAGSTEATCDDGFDDDADYLYDCYDDDCAGSAACPVCSMVDTLSCGDTLVTGDTTAFGSTDVVDSYGGCAPLVDTGGPEYVYRFTPTQTRDVNFTVSGANHYPFLAVVKDNGSGCYVNDCVRADFYSVVFTAEADETYYLLVDGPAEAGFGYQVSLLCPVAAAETNCSDGLDEDGDGRIDCKDPECGAELVCNNNTCDISGTVACGETIADSTGTGNGLMSQYACMPGLGLGNSERVYEFSYASGPDEQEVVVTLDNETSYAAVAVMAESPVYSFSVPVENRYADKSFAEGFLVTKNLLGAGATPQPGEYKYPMVAFFEPDCQIDDGFCPATSCDDTGNVDAVIERMTLREGVDVWRVPPLGPGESYDVEVEIPVSASHQYQNPNYHYIFYYAPLSGFAYDDNFVRGGYVFWGAEPQLNSLYYSYLYDIDSTVSQYADDTTPQNDCASECPPPPGCHVAYYGQNVAPQEVLDITGQTETCHPLACVSGNFYATSFTAQRGVKYYVAVEGGIENEVGYDMSVVCDAPASETNCSNGIDDDGDFFTDCDDDDCAAPCAAGDLCSAGDTLTCGTVRLSGSLAGAGSIADYPCVPALVSEGGETTYRFTASQTGWVNFTTSDRTGYLSVAVIEDNGTCDPYNCVDAQYYGVVAYLQAGQDYFVVVDGTDTQIAVDFVISALCDPPVNEIDCADGVDDDGDFDIDCDDPDCGC